MIFAKKKPGMPRVTGLLTSANHDGPIQQTAMDGHGRWWRCEWTRVPTPAQVVNEERQ